MNYSESSYSTVFPLPFCRLAHIYILYQWERYIGISRVENKTSRLAKSAIVTEGSVSMS